MKKLYYYVRRFFWYRDQGYAELASPLNGFSLFLSGVNFLILYYGYRPPIWEYVVSVLLFVILVGLFGVFMVKRMDSQKIVNRLANGENEMLQEILEAVKHK